jgi:hypothetical protein
LPRIQGVRTRRIVLLKHLHDQVLVVRVGKDWLATCHCSRTDTKTDTNLWDEIL